MKGLKKIALVAAISAAPFAANAEMQALNDTSMSDVTGQAGVTIELQTKVAIGEFKYTDEGDLTVKDIVLGGAGVTTEGAAANYNDLLDELKIDIDVLASGNAVIEVHSLETTPQGVPVPIDWGMKIGSMNLEGTGGSTTLISNLSGYGNLAQLRIEVDTASDHLNLAAAFDVQDMDFDVEFMGIGIRDMKITGAGTNFDYDGDGNTLAGGAATEAGLDPTDPAQALQLGVLTGYANVNLDVYKGANFHNTKQDVLRIDVNNVYMDMSIGAVEIGGTSIGSLAIDNLAVTDTKLAVYGH